MSKVIKGQFLASNPTLFLEKKNVKIPEFLSFPIQLAQLPLLEEAKGIFQRLPFEPTQLWPLFSLPADSIFSFEFLQQPLEWFLAFSVIFFVANHTPNLCKDDWRKKREKTLQTHAKNFVKKFFDFFFFTCSSVSVAAFAMVSWVVLSVKALKYFDWFREM